MEACEVEYPGASARLRHVVQTLLGAYRDALAACVLSVQEAEAMSCHIDEIRDMVGLFAADRFEEEALCVHLERELVRFRASSRIPELL